MGSDRIVHVILALVPLILSLTVHEYSHAWSAWKLGDDTASRMGRMTLNPIAHIDPFGTLLLPALMLWSGGFVFGWAKPVPIDPSRFRREVSQGAGMAITASAGPLSNLVLAVLGTVGLGIYYRYSTAEPGADAVVALLSQIVLLNVTLALFNLIPIPPLDGSRVAAWLMPYRLRNQWHAVEQFAPFLLIAIFFFGGRLIAGPSRFVIGLLESLLRAIA